MRIGIDYRMISAGVSVVNRGMGRYTQQQVRETISLDHTNEYLLFCLPGADHSLILPEIRTAPNVTIKTIDVAAARMGQDPNAPATVLRYAEEYQEWIYRQRVDLYHALTTFAWYDITLSHFDACPLVFTFHDVIPLVFPDQYLRDSETAQRSERLISWMRCSERLIANSHASARDATLYLGFPADRIDVAYPIADPWFQPLPPEIAARQLEGLRRRTGLTERFALSVSHLHHSKNLGTLLEAYAMLPASVRRDMPLVLTSHFLDSERDGLRATADELGIGENLVLTGMVSEAEMVALYNGATVLVHPSRYEGFGLPVVEAMRCGTPVITTTAASLPEVGGDAAVLVDPENARAMAAAIEEVATDPAKRARMREAGLAHAATFSAEQLGSRALACYQAAAAPARRSDRPRLALWTPLPPLRTGIADYSAELLEYIAPAFDVEVFVDDGYLPDQALMSRHVVQHHTAFQRRNDQQPFDAVLYQLGNSLFHTYMYEQLQRHPGIVTIHDLAWINALYGAARENNTIQEFRDELAALEGNAALKEFDHIIEVERDVTKLIAFYGRHYMLKRVIDASKGLIVQSAEECQTLEERYGTSKVRTVPMGVEDPWRGMPPLQTSYVRTQAGISPSAFVVGIFGSVHRIKRIDKAIRAFHRLLASHPDSRLLVVGEASDRAFDQTLLGLVHELELEHHVRIVGRVTEAEFDRLLLACDAIVNLRFPSMKQISAIINRALAAGKPLIISDVPEWRDFPDDCCLRVVPNEREVEVMADHLALLAADPELRRRRSMAARAWYERQGTVAHMAQRYTEVINEVMGLAAAPVRSTLAPRSPSLCSVAALEDFADEELGAIMRELFSYEITALNPDFPQGAEQRRLWESAMAVRSLRRCGALRPDASVLVAGADAHPLLFYLTRHAGSVVAVDRYLDVRMWEGTPPTFMLISPESAPFPQSSDRLSVRHMDVRALHLPDASFDAVVCLAGLAQLGAPEDIAAASYELGRVLKPNGVLAVTVPYRVAGPSDRHHSFTAEDALRLVAEASGLSQADALDASVTSSTLALPRDLTPIFHGRQTPEAARYPRRGELPTPPGRHVLAVEHGEVVGAIHLTLVKSEPYPALPNAWAQPSADTRASVAKDAQLAQLSLLRRAAAPQDRSDAPAPALVQHHKKDAPMSHHVAPSPAELADLLAKWERIRLRGFYNRWLVRLPKPLSAAARAAIRIASLGHLLATESRLLHAITEREATVDSSIATMSARLSQLEQDLGEFLGGSDRAGRGPGHVGARISALDEIQREQQLTIRHIADQLASIEKQLGDSKTIRSLDQERREMSDQLSQLQELVQQTVGHVRLMEQQAEIQRAADRPPAASTMPLSSASLLEIFQSLEAEHSSLAAAQAVEVSIQDGTAESLLAAAVQYFGERMSSATDPYRVPNDVWYHLDFTADWARPVLFTSAARRLGTSGSLVIITSLEHDSPREYDRLRLALNRPLPLQSGETVRLLMWQAE